MATRPDPTRADRTLRSIYVDPSIQPFTPRPDDAAERRAAFNDALAAELRQREIIRHIERTQSRIIIAAAMLLLFYMALGIIVATFEGRL